MTKRMSTRNTSRLVAFALTLALVPSALTACAPSAPAPKPAAAKLKIVASTSVWGSVIEAIAGNKVQITSIVSNPNQDPHSFEASVRDQAAINGADLIFLTGNGYDNFMSPLIAASNQPASHVIALAPNDKTVKPYYGHTVSDPHVWYDFEIVARVANDITSKLGQTDKPDRATFSSGNKTFQAGLTALANRLDKLAHRTQCPRNSYQPPCHLVINQVDILQPESVGLRLMEKFAVDATPLSTRKAVMNGSDINLKDMAAIKILFLGEMTKTGLAFGSMWPIDWFVLNAQQTSPQIKQMIAWAKQAKNFTNIVTFSESLPAGDTYLTWMSANLSQLETVHAINAARF